jgi:hypothetical protein
VVQPNPLNVGANALASSWPQANMPIRSLSPWPAPSGLACGPWPSRWPGHQKYKDGGGLTPKLCRCPTSIGSDAAPVWCHPRRRSEADRSARPSHEAGTRRSQPTDSSVINRRLFLAPALPIDKRQKLCCRRKKSGSQPLTSEVMSTPGVSRALLRVDSTPLLGAVWVSRAFLPTTLLDPSA